MKLFDLIGLKVVAVKGETKRMNTNPKNIDPEYIFFDDGETFIHIEDQDYHEYHDCDASAKNIQIVKSKELYDINMDYEFNKDAKGSLNY